MLNTYFQFKPKKFEDRDIDIKIECCGVCGSDVHTINGGWGDCPLPICVGHEVIGKAIKVGDKVTTVKVGDRVGVGAQIRACLECKLCKSDNENYCPHQVGMLSVRLIEGSESGLLTRDEIPMAHHTRMEQSRRVDTPAT